MITSTIDSSRARRRMRAMRRGLPNASRSALATIGGIVARYAYEHAPEATRKFKNGAHEQVMQCVALGGEVTPTAKPVLRAAPQHEKGRRLLMRQLERATAYRRRWTAYRKDSEARNPYYKRGRRRGMWKSHRDLLREENKAGNIEDRAIETLNEWDANAGLPVTLIRGRFKGDGEDIRRKSSLASLRTKVYGGSAEYMALGTSGHRLTLRHREPHARFVDRKLRLYRRGQASVAFTGAERVSRRHLRQMQTAGA